MLAHHKANTHNRYTAKKASLMLPTIGLTRPKEIEDKGNRPLGFHQGSIVHHSISNHQARHQVS
eukprot:2463214-Prorocentrum_lima.AAC.1